MIAKRDRWRSRLLLARYLAVQAGYYTYMAICSFYRPHVTVAYTAHYNFQAAKEVKYTTRVSARIKLKASPDKILSACLIFSRDLGFMSAV